MPLTPHLQTRTPDPGEGVVWAPVDCSFKKVSAGEAGAHTALPSCLLPKSVQTMGRAIAEQCCSKFSAIFKQLSSDCRVDTNQPNLNSETLLENLKIPLLRMRDFKTLWSREAAGTPTHHSHGPRRKDHRHLAPGLPGGAWRAASGFPVDQSQEA